MIGHLALRSEQTENPDVGLVYPPTVVGRLEPRSQAALNFRGVTLNPPPDGDVVDQKPALSKKFLRETRVRFSREPEGRPRDSSAKITFAGSSR